VAAFVESTKVSLKEMLLHNDKIYPSVPLAHSVHTKDSHARIRTLFNYIDYDKYKWKLCNGLKVMGLRVLLDMQQGYSKCSCFLWEWTIGNITM
jgi:hypothetical protein